MIRARKAKSDRVTQGDIFRDVEFIEYAVERRGVIEFSKIVFPLVIVLTQDCDLEQDHRVRNAGGEAKSEDKLLFSVLVAPIYNAEFVFMGQHLSELNTRMMEINKKRRQSTTAVSRAGDFRMRMTRVMELLPQ